MKPTATPPGYREGPALTVGSLFSGIGGLELGLEQTGGFKTVWQVEIDANANTVRQRHWPDVPAYLDVKEFTLGTDAIRPDLICGGFPCQDLSVAGKRAGLAGERSGLFREFMRIVSERNPKWVLIENVPGLLSSNRGRDMGTVLSTMAELGYGTAYRICDAQWFGVAQRRRRVFIVGCLGDWRRAAQVLFEPESLPWDSPPSREAKPNIAGTLDAGSGVRRGAGINPRSLVSRPLKAGGNDRRDESHDTYILVAHTLRSEGHDASEDGTGRGAPIVPIDMRQASRGDKMTNNRREGSSGGPPGTGIGEPGDPAPTLADSHTPAIAYQCHGSNVGPMGTLRKGNGNAAGGVPFVFEPRIGRNGRGQPSPVVNTLKGSEAGETSDMRPCVVIGGCNGPDKGTDGQGIGMGQEAISEEGRIGPGACPMRDSGSLSVVRRLTPTECERLQGFPDGFTECAADGKPMSDSARYRMLGNAVCVPVARWIGQRILAMEACHATT